MARLPKPSGALPRKQESKKQQEQYARVLIVLEDSKNSSCYFERLCTDFGINEIEIVPADRKDSTEKHGNDPESVIDYAIKRYELDKKKNKDTSFAYVFCVIDRDGHVGYRDALLRARDVQKKIPIIVVSSVPCFEYWLLLHFIGHTRPYETTEKRSPCDNVIQDLTEAGRIPEYAKGGITAAIYKRLKSEQSVAIRHAKQVVKDHQQLPESDWNPSTQMHVLVQFLSNIKNQPSKVNCSIYPSGSELISQLTLTPPFSA